MKKILYYLLLIILSLVLFLSCTSAKKEEIDMIKFESGKYFNKDWNEVVGTYHKEVVPNEKTALEIAKVVFDGMEKNKDIQEYAPQAVFYDEEDEIWVVSFWKESNEISLGGDCNIAIRKLDGKVMRIWFGE